MPLGISQKISNMDSWVSVNPSEIRRGTLQKSLKRVNFDASPMDSTNTSMNNTTTPCQFSWYSVNVCEISAAQSTHLLTAYEPEVDNERPFSLT